MATTASSSPRTGRRRKTAAPPQRKMTGADKRGQQAGTASIRDGGGSPKPGQLVQATGAATSLLPPRDRLLFYGGLGTAAVLGVIEWPIAIAIGAGIAIAQRSHHADGGRPRRSSGDGETT
jgi:hypothetical protein